MLSSSEFPWFRSALKMKVLLNEFGGGITFMFGLTCVYSTKSVFLTGKCISQQHLAVIMTTIVAKCAGQIR
jgi:hypothetical protein